MNRGRNTRGSALKNAAFVSGGVLTDFTGTTAAAALPDQQLPSAVSKRTATIINAVRHFLCLYFFTFSKHICYRFDG